MRRKSRKRRRGDDIFNLIDEVPSPKRRLFSKALNQICEVVSKPNYILFRKSLKGIEETEEVLRKQIDTLEEENAVLKADKNRLLKINERLMRSEALTQAECNRFAEDNEALEMEVHELRSELQECQAAARRALKVSCKDNTGKVTIPGCVKFK